VSPVAAAGVRGGAPLAPLLSREAARVTQHVPLEGPGALDLQAAAPGTDQIAYRSYRLWLWRVLTRWLGELGPRNDAKR